MSRPRGPQTTEAARGEVVRAIRAGELTQRAAATRLGVFRQSICRWHSAHRATREARSRGRLPWSSATDLPAWSRWEVHAVT